MATGDDNQNHFKKGSSILLYFPLYEIISGERVDYTLSTQTLTLSVRGGNVPTTVTKTCTYTPGTSTCHCTLDPADTAMPGEYDMEIEVMEGTKPYFTINKTTLYIDDTQT